MEERPCLISASRSHLTSKLSENPRGSNPTSPTHPAVLVGALTKGTALDISALSAVVDADYRWLVVDSWWVGGWMDDVRWLLEEIQVLNE